MERIRPMLVSRKTLVHRYAAMGFRPSEVWFAADNYVDALGIAPRDTQLYALDAAEVTAFTLYLNRHLVPASPEEHECRTEVIERTVYSLMLDWGSTQESVTERLGLDTSRGATYADILDTVQLYISSKVNCTAVTASMSAITVDGVEIAYPGVVFAALENALLFAASQSSVSPF